MLKINENVIFENVDECKKYFENFIKQNCENDVTMKNNVKSFYKYLKCCYDLQNVECFVKYDDTFLIVKRCLHIVTNKCYYEIDSYYINDEFLFLYDECETFSSLYDVLHELYYSMCDENVSRETLNIFDMINK